MKKQVLIAAIIAFALTGTLSVVLAQTVTYPPAVVTSATTPPTIRSVGPTSVNITTLSLSNTTPTTSPGSVTPSRPVANFSAISAPVWVTTPGNAVQVGNDLIVHGLADIHQGLINTTSNDTVTIYDALNVAGNSAEAGNVTIAGTLNAGAGTSQITGDLRVLGNILVDGSLIFNTTPPTIGSSLVVNGNVTATSIGRYYTPSIGTGSITSTTWVTAPIASCTAGDTLVSCTAAFSGTLPSAGSYAALWFSNANTTANPQTCTVSGRKNNASAPTYTFSAWASCFSPDG